MAFCHFQLYMPIVQVNKIYKVIFFGGAILS